MQQVEIPLMKKLILAAPLALLATSAFAADPVYQEEAPMAVSVGDWTGFYAGVQLGGAFGGDAGILQLSPLTPGLQRAFAPGFNGDFDDSVIGGVHIGYDWQFGNVVVGALADFSATDVSDRQSGYSVTPAAYNIGRELDYLGTLRARIGYAPSDRFLGYVTGGLAYGDVDFTYSQPGSGATVQSITGGQDGVGYAVGAGAEMKATDKISIGLEYLYTNLGGNDYRVNLAGGPFGAIGGPGTTLTGSDGDFDFHTIQMKVSYRF